MGFIGTICARHLQARRNREHDSIHPEVYEFHMTQNTEFSNPASGINPEFYEKTSQLKTLVEELFSMAPKVVCEKICELHSDGKHVLAEGKEKASQASKHALDIVRKHPVETALITVAASLATWWLITRK